MRDDYVFFNAYQDYSPLCWLFTSIKSLETVLMINHDELYDFSEASIAINQPVLDGGLFQKFVSYLSNEGISFDSDFMFDDLFNIPKGKYREIIRNIYKKNNIYNFKNKVFTTTISKDDLPKIKKHIVNNGSLYVSLNKFYPTKSNRYKDYDAYEIVEGHTGFHAVSIIGWDDNFQNTDGTKGAFITLNSAGYFNEHDGINYLPYNSNTISYPYLKGYEYRGEKIIFSESNSNFTNTFNNAYNSKENFKKNSKKAKNKNLFTSFEDIEMSYNFDDKNFDIKNIGFDIFYGQNNINDSFNINLEKNKI